LSGKDHRAAVVWLRDGKRWRYSDKASTTDIRKQDEEYRRQGFQPVDVAGYFDSAERYVALWILAPDREDDVRLLVGIPVGHWKQASEPFISAGLLPRTWQVFPGAEGALLCNAVCGLDASPSDFLPSPPLNH